MAYDIEKILVSESGRIGPDIYTKTLNSSPWLKLIKQDAWPDEMGSQLTVLTYERSLPANTLTWSTVGFNPALGDGDGPGTCVPSAEVINFAQTTRTYNLQQTALESPPICVNDLRYSFRRKEQLSAMFDVLKQNTSYAWQDRYRDEYIRLASHKIIAKAGLPESPTAFPTQAATSKLTQGILDKKYMALIHDSAGDAAVDRVNARPVFMLITSSETSDSLIRGDDNVRNDFRYNQSRVNELLAPLGVERSYRGFYHMIDDFGPRYDFVDGDYVRRYPWDPTVAATYGNKAEISDDYNDAEFEASIIFFPEVYTSLIPSPITSPGGNTSFDPVKYRGDWQWKNIVDRVLNPDGTIGFFRGILSSGSKPVHPEWGMVIMHKRCPADLGLVDCES